MCSMHAAPRVANAWLYKSGTYCRIAVGYD
jgi:hypothetical protein